MTVLGVQNRPKMGHFFTIIWLEYLWIGALGGVWPPLTPKWPFWGVLKKWPSGKETAAVLGVFCQKCHFLRYLKKVKKHKKSRFSKNEKNWKNGQKKWNFFSEKITKKKSSKNWPETPFTKIKWKKGQNGPKFLEDFFAFFRKMVKKWPFSKTWVLSVKLFPKIKKNPIFGQKKLNFCPFSGHFSSYFWTDRQRH